MPGNIERQEKRRRDARRGAWGGTVLFLLTGLVFVCAAMEERGGGLVLAIVLALVSLGMVFPVWKCYRMRIKEIEGGEEDAAAQY